MKKLANNTQILVLLFLIANLGFAQQASNKNDALPESVFGEWHNHKGNNEYNGLLIHPDFIEFGYRAFNYQDISKKSDSLYVFSAKEIRGHSVNYELEVLTKDSIKLKVGGDSFKIYTKHDNPVDGTRLTVLGIPEAFKRSWHTTNGENNLEFTVKDKTIIFRNKEYSIEDLVLFGSKEKGEYRFVVKNKKEYWMFYFKNWNKYYLQVGFHGMMGDLYKANKAYPDYRIDDVEEYVSSIVPKSIRGNWLKTDGSNLWSHSFYYNFAVLDQAKWNYKTISKKRKFIEIVLEKSGVEKTVYAKINTDSTVSFGSNKKQLAKYSLNKTNNPNFKLVNNEVYKEATILKSGTVTYSGIIKNFSKESKQKTGKVSVDNVFTNDQDGYLIKIKDDGSFSVSFPSYHLQNVWVSLPGYYSGIIVEPGKKTWQFINGSDRSEGFFAGDLAQLNTDFASLNFLVFNNEFNNLTRNVNNFTPKGYKAESFKIRDNQLAQLDSISNTRFLSKQVKELMITDLTYRSYMTALGYDMRKRTPYKEKANVDAAYMDFITPEILNNKNAILTSSYDSFINRLKFLRHLREGISVSHPNVSELGKILKAEQVELTEAEEELLALHNKYNEENAEAIKKQKEFSKKNESVLTSTGAKYGGLYQKMTEEERDKFFNGGTLDFDVLQEFAKSKNIDIVFSDEERAYQKAQQNLLTKEEKDRLNTFNSEENNKRNKAFKKKYRKYMDKFISSEFKRQGIEKIREHLGNNFSTNVMVAQEILGSLTRNFIPLTDTEVLEAQKEVKHPFIAKVLKIENAKLKAKIEANKTKTGFVVNETPKTEADKVFDAIISKYKGKVVFVDFWATWCGPCRSGMKQMKPLKEDIKDKDVIFVYITNPSSPETTYNNMIPDIKGEHYRVSQDEWNYLGSKFNITGIPHYLLLDKKGHVVKDNTSDLRRPETVKSLFEAYLKE